MLNKLFTWFEKQINPYPDDDLVINNKNIKNFIIKSLQGSKKWIALLLIFGSLYTILFEVLIIDIIGTVVNWLKTSNPQSFLQEKKYYLLIMLAIMLLSILIEVIQCSINFQTFNAPYAMRLRWWFHKSIINQSVSFFQNEFAGRISAKVMQTALAARDLVAKLINIFCYAFIYFIFGIILIINFNLYLSIPFIIWCLAYTISIKYFIPKIAHFSSDSANARALMTGRINDSYANINLVKLFPSICNNELNYAKSAMQDFIKTAFKQMRILSKLEICMHILNISLIIIVVILGIVLWTNDLVTSGSIVAATTMAIRLNGLSRWMMWEAAGMFEQLGIVQDGINTFSKKSSITDSASAKELIIHNKKIQIDFNNISFAYDSNIKNIFENFNLHIKPGEKIGIVGKSGSGKTTLINLLLRFYDVQKGFICINGENINNFTQDSLRKNIAVVTQDVSLLHRTIRENIAYGSDNFTEENIISASKMAHAHEFIQSLYDAYGNKAYDSFVGERGVKLSGGQRQRIAIARVIMKNAPILILDEATSALDSQIELEIQNSLKFLMQDKTVLAIAHRLSTIAQMDRLIVLDNGQIIESGTHKELLKLNGLYAQLWYKQSGGFTLED